jgi:membrane dipeptidase
MALAYNRDVTQTISQINQREAQMRKVKGWGDATSALPEMRSGRVAVILATLFARVNSDERNRTSEYLRTDYDYRTPAIAHAVAHGQLAYYRQLREDGELAILRSRNELDKHWHLWQNSGMPDTPVGAIIAMEGADPIVSPAQVQYWFERGLRSVMLTHFGRNQYAVGTGQNGPLSLSGIELLKEFERIGMILDVSHLCDESFYQALDVFRGPVIASHSNCRAIVPGDRQLSDEQLRLLIERNAVIGTACDAWMLAPDWQIGVSQRDRLTMEAIVDQIDHVCQLAGSARNIGIGSDVGAAYGREQLPMDFQSIADLQRLAPLLSARGFSEEEIDCIFHGNWLRFFRNSLPPS